MYRFFATFSIFLLLFVSCRREKQEYGFVRLVFQHQWDGQPMRIDDGTPYVNAAENIVTWDRLWYIISDLTIGTGNSAIRVGRPEVHFIDRDTTILLTYQFPVGLYRDISFIFGLDEQQNQTGRFPEIANMFWPEHMGGGYHYMMLDGWWTSSEGPRPANLHLGALEEIVGIDTLWNYNDEGERDGISQIMTTFAKYHNFLRVTIPRSFTVEANAITTIAPIIMDVEQWMKNPNLWNFNVMGYGCIMRRRHAMDSLAENGANGIFRGANVVRGNRPEYRTVTVFR
ncbi:MAG: hypothetical protein FWC98_05275 [Bacteroidales bacterium]|nr:hypothetical protein [Bacteroidales bacterium]